MPKLHFEFTLCIIPYSKLFKWFWGPFGIHRVGVKGKVCFRIILVQILFTHFCDSLFWKSNKQSGSWYMAPIGAMTHGIDECSTCTGLIRKGTTYCFFAFHCNGDNRYRHSKFEYPIDHCQPLKIGMILTLDKNPLLTNISPLVFVIRFY